MARADGRDPAAIETLHDVVVVPDVAVQRGPDGLFAYVVGKDGKAEMRKLEGGRHTRMAAPSSRRASQPASAW